MAVQFILGRSGTGKTTYCIKSVTGELAGATSGPPLVLLVPEQATYQAQRAILANENISGYSRLRVLSFERLSFWLTGKNNARPEISRIGREMIIQKMLRACRSKLTLLGRAAQTPGAAAKLAEVIIEMQQCNYSTSEVSQLARDLAEAEPRERPNTEPEPRKRPNTEAESGSTAGPNENARPQNVTAMKFADIALIFKEYTEFIAEKFDDPDIQLSNALKKIQQADFLRGAKLWVDGFADFTVQQRLCLVEMLKAASESYIALCIDPHTIDITYPDRCELDDTSLFGPTEQTFSDLTEAVRKCRLPLEKPILLKKPMRFTDSPPLEHIEKNIFNPAAPPVTARDDIQILSTANRRTEVEYIAGRISELVRRHNYRYREIAVIIPDITPYQYYIEALFNDFNIPFFIDKPKPLCSHPAVELINSALRVVTNGWGNSDVFACLKTGLAAVEQTDVDVLENYCLAFGARAEDWLARGDWAFAPKDDNQFDEEMINKIRRNAIAPLFKLRTDLGIGQGERLITAGQFTKAVWRFLERLDIKRTLEQWSKQDSSDRQEGHRQLYDKLVNLFDELDEIFGEDLMTVADWNAILATALSKLTLKRIPPTLDQVLVGSIERSRHPDLKAVFLAGATQRQFPQPVTFDGILTDDDRTVAANHDFYLAEKAVKKLTNRQYLAYIAFTRPSRYLCITYPLTTDSSTPVMPSPFLDNLKSLFVDLTEQTATGNDDIEHTSSETQLEDFLCEKLGKDSLLPRAQADKLYALIEALEQNKKFSRLSRQVKYALGYENKAVLHKDFATDFYGDSLECSSTRLGSFAACPYKYFAEYVLDLKRRKQFILEPLDLGRFYHRVLDGLFKRLNKDNTDFATASDEFLQNACSEVIATTIETDSFLSNFKKRSLHNAYILDSATDTLTRAVADYAKMAKAGSFRQIASEFQFGLNDKDIPPCRLKTPDKVDIFLKGIIDRIDCANIKGTQVALILDYKRRPQSFSWSRFYHALDMQLAVYMLAIAGARVAGRKIDSAAGAFYLPVEAAPAKGNFGDLERQADKFARKAKGIFNGRFADALHSELTPGRWDQFYNFFITKGQPYGHFSSSGALRPDEFEHLVEFARAKIIQTAEQITSGCIDIRPYRLGNKSPCSYCNFRAVCKFDWQINEYRPLDTVSKEQVLKQAKG